MRSTQHPSGINSQIVAKIWARRGRLHAFETLEPTRTALVVIDLNAGSVTADAACSALVPRVNRLAAALRNGGGRVAWVSPDFVATENTIAIFGDETAARFTAQVSGDGSALWHELYVGPSDLRAKKTGFSAFFPGKCYLHEQLQAAGINALLIAGTVTNICVDSSARDAVELGYRVTLVSDACAGHAFGLHEAALNTFYRTFGDVRPVADVIRLISEARVSS